MNNKGYGIKVMKGSLVVGFEMVEFVVDFVKDFDKEELFFKDCDF